MDRTKLRDRTETAGFDSLTEFMNWSIAVTSSISSEGFARREILEASPIGKNDVVYWRDKILLLHPLNNNVFLQLWQQMQNNPHGAFLEQYTAKVNPAEDLRRNIVQARGIIPDLTLEREKLEPWA